MKFSKNRLAQLMPSAPAWAALTCALLIGALVHQDGTIFAQSPYNPMPELAVIRFTAPVEAHRGQDLGGQVVITIVNHGTGASADGYTLDFVMSSDRKVPNEIPTYSPSYREDVLISGGRVENLPALEPEDTYTFTQMRLVIPHDVPVGSFYVCAFVDSHNVIEEESREEKDGLTQNSLCAPMHILPDSPAFTPPPPPSSSGKNSRFDANSNCLYENEELFRALEQWLIGTVSDPLFFEIFDAWVSQQNLCASAASASSLQIRRTGRGLAISASSETWALDAALFDASGRLIHSRRAGANRLVLDVAPTAEWRLANGFYLLKIRQRTADGVITLVRKIWIADGAHLID